MPDLIAFDTEDDSKRFSDSKQDHAGYEKVCTQIAAIDARSGERFHFEPTANRKRKRGRYTENVWDVQPFLDWLDSRGSVRCYAHNLSYDIGNIWRDRLEAWKAYAGRLEEAGDEVAAKADQEWAIASDIESAIDDWTKAKETKP